MRSALRLWWWSLGRSFLGLLALGWLSGCDREVPSSVSTVADAAPRAANVSAPDLPLPPAAPAPPAILPRFTNIAVDAGVDFTFFTDSVPGRFFLPEVMGGGVAICDYDQDGWPDLYFANGKEVREDAGHDSGHRSQLFRNLDGSHFQQVSDAAAAAQWAYGQGIAVGDFDADGFDDLFLANYGADILLHNQGDGTFVDVTSVAGTRDDEWSSSTVWLDVDRDGDLDLYVVNYLNVSLANCKVCYYNEQPGYCGPGEYQAVPDRLYLNQGDGTFQESLHAMGMAAEEGKGLAIVAVDFDHDLIPEIYVANDMAPNFLFTHRDASIVQTTGKTAEHPYVEVGREAGCAVSGMGLNEASMGISCTDFDGDGFTDVYLTHFLSSKNTLYRNLGQLMFVDDSSRSRSAATSMNSLGFGTVPLDFDRDGANDIFLANGHVLGPNVTPNKMRPQLLHNRQGRIFDVTEFMDGYFAELWFGRGAAGGDLDHDGDLDLVVTHLDQPVALLRNDTQPGGAFIGFELRSGNRIPPVGGRVVVTTSQGTRTLPMMTGGSYLSAHDPRLLVGLKDQQTPVSVEVHWPSGVVQKHTGLDLNRYWLLREGEEPLLRMPAGGQVSP